MRDPGPITALARTRSSTPSASAATPPRCGTNATEALLFLHGIRPSLAPNDNKPRPRDVPGRGLYQPPRGCAWAPSRTDLRHACSTRPPPFRLPPLPLPPSPSPSLPSPPPLLPPEAVCRYLLQRPRGRYGYTSNTYEDASEILDGKPATRNASTPDEQPDDDSGHPAHKIKIDSATSRVPQGQARAPASLACPCDSGSYQSAQSAHTRAAEGPPSDESQKTIGALRAPPHMPPASSFVGST